MPRAATIILAVVSFALFTGAGVVGAQANESQLPRNTIDCKQFKKVGPNEWTEVGVAVFDLGAIDDIHLTDQPVIPGFFKFGGHDLYPVLEQKCGAAGSVSRGNASQAKGDYHGAIVAYNEALRIDPKSPGTAIQRVIALRRLTENPKPQAEAQVAKPPEENRADPKVQLEQHVNASAAPQTNLSEYAPEPGAQPVDKIVLRPMESASCGDKRSIYVADNPAGANGGKAVFEIVFRNRQDGAESGGSNSEFIIRELRNDKLEWLYRGKISRDKFVFTPVQPAPERRFGRFLFASSPIRRHGPVTIAISFVKPNRNATGEPILYLAGLRSLFSKRSGHRFKFEGKHPAEFLPEAFYFDRCE